MRQYIAIIHKDAESDYGVSFPDFPGAITAGSTLDEAHRMAAEALQLHVEGMIQDGEAIPEPTSLDAVMADPNHCAGVAILVPLADAQPKSVRANITAREDILAAIDAYAEGHGMTRSGFLICAAQREMERA